MVFFGTTFLEHNLIVSYHISNFIDIITRVKEHGYNDLFSSVDKGITTQAVYLNISKAFDRVWHMGL